jgi:hypothetical protein
MIDFTTGAAAGRNTGRIPERCTMAGPPHAIFPITTVPEVAAQRSSTQGRSSVLDRAL